MTAACLGCSLQVRCLAVCKAWRQLLHPRRLPLEKAALIHGWFRPRLSQWLVPKLWVCSTQPAARQVLVSMRGLRRPDEPAISWETPGVQDVYSTLLSLHPRSVSLQASQSHYLCSGHAARRDACSAAHQGVLSKAGCRGLICCVAFCGMCQSRAGEQLSVMRSLSCRSSSH